MASGSYQVQLMYILFGFISMILLGYWVRVRLTKYASMQDGGSSGGSGGGNVVDPNANDDVSPSKDSANNNASSNNGANNAASSDNGANNAASSNNGANPVIPTVSGTLTPFNSIELNKTGGWCCFTGGIQDGTNFLLVSDKGDVLKATPQVAADGKLTGLQSVSFQKLKDLNGVPIQVARSRVKALTKLKSGEFMIFTENAKLFYIYTDILGTATFANVPQAIKDITGDHNVEAMTTLPDGRVLMIAENAVSNAHSCWVAQDSGSGQTRFTWTTFSLTSANSGFRISDCFASGTKVYVLQIQFANGVATSMIMSFDISAVVASATVTMTKVADNSPTPYPSDNYEYLFVANLAGKNYMIVGSDDNAPSNQKLYMNQFLMS